MELKPGGPEPGPPRVRGRVPPAPSMALLQTVWDSALDPGYRSHAEKGPRGLSFWGGAAVAVLGLLLGFVTAVAAQNLRVREEAQEQVKTQLTTEIQGRQELITQLEGRVESLGNELLAAESVNWAPTTLGETASVLAAAAPVVGEGVRVTVSELDEGGAAGRTLGDADVRFIVNLLWEAGAEGIAVNGNRLGADTAIRTAGSAILVDLQPVSTPVVIEATGDSAQMKRALTAGPSAGKINELAADLGVQVDTARAEELWLAGAGLPQYKQAAPLEEVGDEA